MEISEVNTEKPRLAKSSRLRKILRYLVSRNAMLLAVCLALLFAVAAQASGSMNFLAQQEDAIRQFQVASPILAIAVGAIVYFVACFIPGTNGKALVAGWILGPLVGTLVINVASTGAAIVMFYAAHRWYRARLQSKYAVRLDMINQHIQTDGGSYLFSLRLIPMMPYALLNALMAATPIRTRTFWWATQLGLLPSNCIYAWVGSNLPSLSKWETIAWSDVLSWQLIAGLVLISLIPWVMRCFTHSVSPKLTS